MICIRAGLSYEVRVIGVSTHDGNTTGEQSDRTHAQGDLA